MCCLKYEQDSYEHLMKITPSLGSTVKSPEGSGTVIDVNLITGNLIVKPAGEDAVPFKTHRDRVKIISHGKRKKSNKEEE
jgi:cell fate regulator YaaT (PSP1 superfamily)